MTWKVSAEKSANSIMGFPLYIKYCFLLMVLSISLTFDILIIIKMVYSLYLIWDPGRSLYLIWNSLGFLDLRAYLPPHTEEVFTIISSNKFFAPFSPSLSRTFIMTQRSLKVSLLFKILFCSCLGESHCFVFQFSNPFFCFIQSAVEILIYFPVQLLYFSTLWLLYATFLYILHFLKFSRCSSISLLNSVNIFRTITLNPLSGSLLTYISVKSFLFFFFFK